MYNCCDSDGLGITKFQAAVNPLTLEVNASRFYSGAGLSDFSCQRRGDRGVLGGETVKWCLTSVYM